MKSRDTDIVLREFREIPGVGKSIALNLWTLGIRSTVQLGKKDPEKLYARYCRIAGGPVDRCLLYVFRCAVYFASLAKHNPQLLLRWNSKDKN